MPLWIRTVVRAFLVAASIFCVQAAWAIQVSGIFAAERSCPAYVSKNKRTNPDGIRIGAGERYQALETNKPDNPNWYRIRVSSAEPRERWVSADCGKFRARETEENGGTGATCNVAGQADSYVLALSWQPAFCETTPEKPECRITEPTAYQARHFTLHGLWPNKQGCGISYGFCGEVKTQEQDFCDYPMVVLNTASRISLAQVMPSVEVGSCLERHEWYKHGTCQTVWSDDEYFDVSVDLTRQFNESGMAYFMNRKIGQEVRTEDFLARLVAVLGTEARERVKLECDEGMLVEVQISLIGTLTPGTDLETLITQAPRQSGSDCGPRFRVDPIGLSDR
jgi:ribonuclease T2